MKKYFLRILLIVLTSALHPYVFSQKENGQEFQYKQLTIQLLKKTEPITELISNKQRLPYLIFLRFIITKNEIDSVEITESADLQFPEIKQIDFKQIHIKWPILLHASVPDSNYLVLVPLLFTQHTPDPTGKNMIVQFKQVEEALLPKGINKNSPVYSTNLFVVKTIKIQVFDPVQKEK